MLVLFIFYGWYLVFIFPTPVLPRVAKFCPFSSSLQRKEDAVPFPLPCHYFLFLQDLQMLTVSLEQVIKEAIV